jgi:hypothetical protein
MTTMMTPTTSSMCFHFECSSGACKHRIFLRRRRRRTDGRRKALCHTVNEKETMQVTQRNGYKMNETNTNNPKRIGYKKTERDADALMAAGKHLITL